MKPHLLHPLRLLGWGIEAMWLFIVGLASRAGPTEVPSYVKTLTRPAWGITLCVGLATAGASPVEACNIPVFRYALERWRADAYRLTIVQRGPLDAAGEKLVAELHARHAQRAANIEVRQIDLSKPATDDSPPTDDRAWLAASDAERLPLLALQYPWGDTHQAPLAMGGFTTAGVEQLLDSPARRELVRRLSAGQTVVWLFVPSNDPAQNASCHERLTAVSQKLAETLKLPELTDAAEDTLLSTIPLRIEFSTLTVRRDDPAERGLLTMLLHSEPDLPTLDEPLVFPIFGRGRSLLALAGDGISESTMRAAAELLCGACSCEVKDLHPGFDLLLAQRWESLLTPAAAESLARSSPSAQRGVPELIAIPPGAGAVPTTSPVSLERTESSPPSRVTWPLALGALGTLVLVCGYVLVKVI